MSNYKSLAQICVSKQTYSRVYLDLFIKHLVHLVLLSLTRLFSQIANTNN